MFNVECDEVRAGIASYRETNESTKTSRIQFFPSDCTPSLTRPRELWQRNNEKNQKLQNTYSILMNKILYLF